MDNKISIISDQFQNESGSETVEGITIIINGKLKQIMDVLRENNEQYESNIDVVHDAFLRGLDDIRKDMPKC